MKLKILTVFLGLILSTHSYSGNKGGGGGKKDSSKASEASEVDNNNLKRVFAKWLNFHCPSAKKILHEATQGQKNTSSKTCKIPSISIETAAGIVVDRIKLSPEESYESLISKIIKSRKVMKYTRGRKFALFIPKGQKPIEFKKGIKVPSLNSLTIMLFELEQKIALGGSHSCFLEKGKVFCWGSNNFGQLGRAHAPGDEASTNPVPQEVPDLEGVEAISLGGTHTCALQGGKVFCWGTNKYGQLGRAREGDELAPNPVPQQVPGLRDVKATSLGQNHTCALKKNGKVFCWGMNYHGQLGRAPRVDRHALNPEPQEVLGLEGVEAISLGSSHTCALQGGKVFCWGRNASGQLGRAPGPDLGASNPVPQQVPDLEGVEAISLGSSHTCALQGGKVFCWGSNNNGELGRVPQHGRFGPNPVPQQVPGLEGVEAISLGDSHTCALQGGKVFCWGSLLKKEQVPQEVPGLIDVKAISLGQSHHCALKRNGKVFCWGYNRSGQLGRAPGPGRWPTSPRPQEVRGLP